MKILNMGFKAWLYLLGLGGAVLFGLLEGLEIYSLTFLSLLLIVLGLLIGIFNISSDETLLIIVSALLLGVGSGVLSALPFVGNVLEPVFANIAFISVPVAIPPAIKVLLGLAQ